MNRKRKPDDTPSEILSSIKELVKIRKAESMQQESSMKSELISPKFISIFANLDRMFQQLPGHVVERLGKKFNDLAYEELEKITTYVILDPIN